MVLDFSWVDGGNKGILEISTVASNRVYFKYKCLIYKKKLTEIILKAVWL